MNTVLTFITRNDNVFLKSNLDSEKQAYRRALMELFSIKDC